MGKNGIIYILTNPSFEQYIKIGYTTDLKKRLNELSSKTAVPYSFQAYATWDVPDLVFEKYGEKSDTYIHGWIDKIDDGLRCIETTEKGKDRVREFYIMTPEKAFSILEQAAKLFEEKPVIVRKTEEELDNMEDAYEDKMLLDHNRHHFKDINFRSSLTNKEYYTRTKSDGTLGIYEADSDIEVQSHAKISKRQIVLQALKDLGEIVEPNQTLYQLMHRLEKIVE